MQRGKTGKGYIYYRTRANGDDWTVYEHQLMALLENDPADVFDPETEVHHLTPARDVNAPWLLDLVDAEEHRARRRDRAQYRVKGEFPTPEGEEIVVVSVEPDESGTVEAMATEGRGRP